MRCTLAISAVVAVFVASCSSAPAPGGPLEVAAVAGHWRGENISLDIGADGVVAYHRTGGSSTHLTGLPLEHLSTTGFDVGVGFLSTHFVIGALPATVGGTTTMTLDGVVLRKISDAEATATAVIEAEVVADVPPPPPAPPPSTLPAVGTLPSLVGLWMGGDILMRVQADGTLTWRRGGNTLDGVKVEKITPASFEAGLFGLTTTFKVNSPPAVVDGKVQMTVDGVVLTRVVDGTAASVP